MSEKWKIVDTRKKAEIWLFDDSQSSPLIWGVERGADEPLYVGPGTSVYGLPKNVLTMYLDTVIRPALDGTSWNQGHMFEILEHYLRKPEEVASLLALLTGRLHLASQIHVLSSRLSDLFIHYLRQLPLSREPHEKLLFAGWCYQLANAFFVSAHHESAAANWVKEHSQMINKAFFEGAKELIDIVPALLSAGQVSVFQQQMSLLLAYADLNTPWGR